MLSNEQRVNGREAHLFIGTNVSREKQVVRITPGVFEVELVEGKEKTGLGRLELAAHKRAKTSGSNQVRTINIGTVHKAGNQVEMLANIVGVLHKLRADHLHQSALLLVEQIHGKGGNGKIRTPKCFRAFRQVNVVIEELEEARNRVKMKEGEERRGEERKNMLL